MSSQSSYFILHDLFSQKTSKQNNKTNKFCFLRASLALVKKKHVPTQVHSGPPSAFIPISSLVPSATQFTKKQKLKKL